MRKLKIGDTYSHKSHKKYILTITKREGDIIMAFNPEYGYEVFKVRLRKEKKWREGSVTPAGEYPPSSSEFGKSAVHYPPKLYHLAEKVFSDYVLKFITPATVQNFPPCTGEEIILVHRPLNLQIGA